MIAHYADVMPDGRVRAYLSCDDEEEGAELHLWHGQAEGALVRLDSAIDWRGPSDTALLFMTDGALTWIETAPIEELRSLALEQIDAAGEALRMAVINRMPTQTEEYRQTLQQALAWRAAGYPESEEQPAPPDVTSWAMAKWRDGWTSRQAADDILTVADQWSAVISRIRLLRLVNKEDVRHAADPAAVRAIVADMRTDMRAIAAQLNLTTAE